MKTHIILYVRDQQTSTDFYAEVLNKNPILNLPGMTEFELSQHTILGLMPVSGIKKLLGSKLPDMEKAAGIPRSEVYLVIDNAQEYCDRTVLAGAALLSPLQQRDWNHKAAYFLDPDGHVLAFAETLK